MSKKFMLTLPLQYFSGGGELDLSSLRSEFEDSYEETDTTDDEVVEETDELETETEEEVVDNEDDLGAEDDEDLGTNEEDLEDQPDDQQETRKQTKEENSAFAEMRRKQQEMEQQLTQRNTVLEKIAAQYGMTVEQFEQAYADQQTEARAKEQGIPVDVLKRLEQLESENSQVKVQAAQDKYLAEVSGVVSKFGLDDAEVQKVYQYIGEKGLYDANLRVPTIDFETAYKIANFDNLLDRKTKESKQADLEKKRARQKTSAVVTSNASATTNNDSDYSEEFDKRLERLKNNGML